VVKKLIENAFFSRARFPASLGKKKREKEQKKSRKWETESTYRGEGSTINESRESEKASLIHRRIDVLFWGRKKERQA